MRPRPTGPRRFGAFDWFVAAGGAVNAAVVAVLILYWLAN